MPFFTTQDMEEMRRMAAEASQERVEADARRAAEAAAGNREIPPKELECLKRRMAHRLADLRQGFWDL